MRWESRKPRWPLFVGLACLFVLSLATPQGWKGCDEPCLRSMRAKFSEAKPTDTAMLRVPLAEQPLPTPREFDFEQLIDLRDLLQNVFLQLPKVIESQESVYDSLPVRVSNSDERLAMLDRRLRHLPSNPPSSASQRNTFAEVLLEAAGASENKVEKTPRVAQRDKPYADSPTLKPMAEQPAVSVVQAPIPRRPIALFRRLGAYPADSPVAEWAQKATRSIGQLTSPVPAASTTDVAVQLDEIAQLVAEGTDGAAKLSDAAARRDWQQSIFALERRLPIWRALAQGSSVEEVEEIDPRAANDKLTHLVGEIVELLGDEPNGEDWRAYLLLDRVAAAASEGVEFDTIGRSELAQKILRRMSDIRLTLEQRAFLAGELFGTYRKHLHRWAALPVDFDVLIALVERYELNRQPSYAAAIAQLQQRLQFSDKPQHQSLASHLDKHYRKANMRLAVTDDLLNRLMPKQRDTVMPVSDRIAGARVLGRSRTTAHLEVQLLPDPDQLRFGLDASGRVYSVTRTDTWPARVQNAAKFKYQARKEIVVGEEGVTVAPTRAQAQGRNVLLDVDSRLDPVPLVGHLLRDLARQKHRKSRPRAVNEVKQKVARQVRQRMDSQADEKLHHLEQKFRSQVLSSLNQLALVAEPTEMATSDERAVMQFRLANADQLAAHTPRPLAPSDSLMSYQLHESVLNNALAGLGLNGRRMTVEELFYFFTERFGQTDVEPPTDMPRRAKIEFALRDAICIHCRGDRLELVLNIKQLSRGRDKIRNFTVHAHFRPVMDGLDVRLIRDGSLQFAGRRLKTGPRVVLHSVLGKVMAKDREFRLFAPGLLDDPRLAGLMVTQLVLDDGWIGLALGPAHPERVAWRASTSAAR